jgi:hypothetical protein
MPPAIEGRERLQRRAERIPFGDRHQAPFAGTRHENEAEFRAAFRLPTAALEPLYCAAQRCSEVSAASETPAIDDLPLKIPDDDIVPRLSRGERIATSAAHAPIVESVDWFVYSVVQGAQYCIEPMVRARGPVHSVGGGLSIHLPYFKMSVK